MKYERMLYEKTFTLSPILPFRLDFTVWALRRRQKNAIDSWDGTTYSRIFVVNKVVFQSQVTQINDLLQVRVKSSNPHKNTQLIITDKLNKMLGLEINIEEFYKLSKPDKYLQPLAQSFIGVKPLCFPSVFEALLNAVACQQVTLDLGILLLNRLAENYGQKFVDGNKIQYAFPAPEDLESISVEAIKRLGFSYQKSRAIKDLTQTFLLKDAFLSSLENMTNAEAVASMSELRGIGRWSSEYVLLRGFRRLDVFPGDDVGAQKNLQQLFGLEKRPGYEEIKQLVAKWQPYAGMIYFHLLLEKLQKKVNSFVNTINRLN